MKFLILDAEIRAILNSYQYLRKLLNERLDIQVRLEPLIYVRDYFTICKIFLIKFCRMMMKYPRKFLIENYH